jgi:predicted HTH domain antitoxin
MFMKMASPGGLLRAALIALGRRLRAAGVSLEDRQDLLAQRSRRITTHYSAAELSRLIDAADRVTEQN